MGLFYFEWKRQACAPTRLCMSMYMCTCVCVSQRQRLQMVQMVQYVLCKLFYYSFHPVSTGMFIAKGVSRRALSCFDFACL